MPDIKSLKLQHESLSTINDFFSAYQRLTIYQMQKNRTATINSRTFSDGLIETFIDVKQALKKLFDSSKHKDKISFSTLEKNGRSVAVFISFETKFSTEVFRRSFAHFKESIAEGDYEIVLLGSTAKRLFSEYYPEGTPFTYFDISEKNINISEKSEFFEHILKYETVEVYYPFFVSLLQQEAQSSTISGDVPVGDTLLEAERQNRRYFFEPDKQIILHFFEVQILRSILQQKIREAQLATLGARITTLQYTQQNIEEELHKVHALTRKSLKKQSSRKQRNRLAGMNLW